MSNSKDTNPKPLLVVAAMILRSGQVLVAQRPHGAKFGAGLWEFPGGKVDFGERPEASLAREIFEELNAEVRVKELVGVTSHTDLSVSLHIVLLAYICEFLNSDADPASANHGKVEAADVRWVPLNQLKRLINGEEVVGLRMRDFAPGDHEPLKLLAARQP